MNFSSQIISFWYNQPSRTLPLLTVILLALMICTSITAQDGSAQISEMMFMWLIITMMTKVSLHRFHFIEDEICL